MGGVILFLWEIFLERVVVTSSKIFINLPMNFENIVSKTISVQWLVRPFGIDRHRSCYFYIIFIITLNFNIFLKVANLNFLFKLNVWLLLGREHLRLYARLRGLDEASAKIATETGLKKLGLVAYADRYDKNRNWLIEVFCFVTMCLQKSHFLRLGISAIGVQY